MLLANSFSLSDKNNFGTTSVSMFKFKGFNNEENSAGNGLKSMEKRAEEIGAKFEIQSSEKGTKISLSLPI